MGRIWKPRGQGQSTMERQGHSFGSGGGMTTSVGSIALVVGGWVVGRCSCCGGSGRCGISLLLLSLNFLLMLQSSFGLEFGPFLFGHELLHRRRCRHRCRHHCCRCIRWKGVAGLIVGGTQDAGHHGRRRLLLPLLSRLVHHHLGWFL